MYWVGRVRIFQYFSAQPCRRIFLPEEWLFSPTKIYKTWLSSFQEFLAEREFFQRSWFSSRNINNRAPEGVFRDVWNEVKTSACTDPFLALAWNMEGNGFEKTAQGIIDDFFVLSFRDSLDWSSTWLCVEIGGKDPKGPSNHIILSWTFLSSVVLLQARTNALLPMTPWSQVWLVLSETERIGAFLKGPATLRFANTISILFQMYVMLDSTRIPINLCQVLWILPRRQEIVVLVVCEVMKTFTTF